MYRREFGAVVTAAGIGLLSGCATIESAADLGALRIQEVFLTGGEERGDPLWTSITIENTGRASREGTVVATMGDEPVDRSTVSLSGRGAAGVQFEADTAAYDPGTQTVTVAVADDVHRSEVEIPG